jgi:hypothetical protein
LLQTVRLRLADLPRLDDAIESHLDRLADALTVAP